MAIIAELPRELYSGNNPFDSAANKYIDTGYRHSFVMPEFIEAVLATIQPAFWLEIGSMVGGSAVKTAQAADKLSIATEIVCLDPFCADVAAWAEETRPVNQWRCLKLENGRPTIYERFLANVSASGYSERILPIPVTSAVGIKLLQRLFDERRISGLPSVIFLDSAHEQGETLLEISSAWSILPKGGILIGDDWNWEAVSHDVISFARTVPQNPEHVHRFAAALPQGSVISVEKGVMTYKGRPNNSLRPWPQWLLFK